MFGGVSFDGRTYNCGQVRGPMQLTFARSIDPLFPGCCHHQGGITRRARTRRRRSGASAQVPYALYLARGSSSPMLAGTWKLNEKGEVVGVGKRIQGRTWSSSGGRSRHVRARER